MWERGKERMDVILKKKQISRWAELHHLCAALLHLVFLSQRSRWGGSVGGEPERPVDFKWWKAACFRQTVNSLKCLLRLSLTGVDLMNRSYNYQTAGHGHYCSRPACKDLCAWKCARVLTQPLAELGGRCSQTGDPTSVTPQVLVLGRRGNVPYLHRCVSAWEW